MTRNDFGGDIQRSSARRIAEQALGDGEAESGDAHFVEAAGVEQAAAAEIGKPDQLIICVRRDQDVGRLQILVQHADAVRGGDGVGDLQEHGEPLFACGRGQILLCPFEQILAAVGAFEIERRRLEVPVGQFDEMGLIVEAFL